MFEIPDILDVPEIYFESPEPPSFPEITLLYGLTPRGLGTGACESQKSYISRLADAHRVSPGTLIKEVLYNKLLAHNLTWKGTSTWCLKGNSQLYIGMGKVTRGLTKVLSEATGIEGLEYCTMLPLQGVLNSNGLFSSRERHCPLCLHETREASSLHGHLIWDVACVTACPIHKVRLMPSECGAGDNDKKNFGLRKILSGVCSTCGSIGYRCKNETAAIPSEVEVWKAQQVAELISRFPLAHGLFSKQNTIDGLMLLVSGFAGGKPAVAASRAGIFKSVLWGWEKGNFLPSLEPLLRICLAAEVSLVSVMEGNPVECSCPPPEIEPPKGHASKPTKEERENALKEALIINPPPSLASIARALNIDGMTLYHSLPELSARVVERFRQFESFQRSERRKQARELADGLKKELTEKGLPFTRRNFEAAVGKPIIPNRLLHQALMEILPGHEFSAIR